MANGAGTQYLPGGGEGKVEQWLGIYLGYIAVNQDPLAMGRVKLRVPQVFGGTTSGWASPMVPLAYVPKVGTGVTVMFVGGDPTQPVWFGNFALPGGSTGFIISPTEPTSPQIGTVWVNSETGLMSEFNGAGWVEYQIGGAAIQTGASLQEPNIFGGVITGAQFIADGAGSEYLGYSGTPGSGNLVLAISPAAGSDTYGNSWGEGISVFDTASNYIAIIPGSTNYIALFSGAEYSDDPPYIYGSLFNPGTVSEYQFLGMVSGQQTGSTGNAAVQLFSDSNNGTANTANGSLVITGNQIAGWNATNFTTQKPLVANGGYKSPNSTLTGGGIITQVDNGFLTQTNATTFSKLSNEVWSIPAGDAVEGTCYRLTTFGVGQWEAEVLDLAPAALGCTWLDNPITGGGNGMSIGADLMAAGASFQWECVATLIVNQTGASPIVTCIVRMSIDQYGQNEQPGTDGGVFVGAFNSSTMATGASSMVVQHKWSASNASQSLTSWGSVFERIGGTA